MVELDEFARGPSFAMYLNREAAGTEEVHAFFGARLEEIEEAELEGDGESGEGFEKVDGDRRGGGDAEGNKSRT